MASISRRAAFGMPAALALGSTGGMGRAPAPSAASRHPDHDLLALAGRLATHRKRLDHLCDLQCEAQDRGDTKRDDRLHAIQISSVPYGHELEELMAAHPARTRDGIHAKARAVLTKVQFLSDGAPHFDDALAWSLAMDVLGGSDR